MLIGEISKITGLSKDTIRYYEKRNLIEVNRTASNWNNYKDYNEENIRSLLLIKWCKGFGFTLNEISDILTLVESGDATCKTVSNLVTQKLSDINEKISELEQVKQMIIDRLDVAVINCSATADNNGNCSELDIAIDRFQ